MQDLCFNHSVRSIGNDHGVAILVRIVKQQVIVAVAIIGSVQLLSRKKAVGVPFATADHILSVYGHGGTLIGRVVGATGLKSIEGI